MGDFNSHLVQRVIDRENQLAKEREEEEELIRTNLVLEKERAYGKTDQADAYLSRNNPKFYSQEHKTESLRRENGQLKGRPESGTAAFKKLSEEYHNLQEQLNYYKATVESTKGSQKTFQGSSVHVFIQSPYNIPQEHLHSTGPGLVDRTRVNF